VTSHVIRIERRYVYEDVDRHGNVRIYFWRGKGHRKVRISERPGTEEFDRRYHELLKQGEAGGFKPAPRDAPKHGTFRWLCIEHFKSASFKQLDPRTQHVTKLIVEKMYVEPIAPGAKEVFGDCPLKHFNARSVVVLRDRRADKHEAANNRVRRLRRIFGWALDNHVHDDVKVNPAREIKFLKPQRAGGFPVWSRADIEKFEARYSIGTKPRLALALLFYTGGRRSDVVRLGKQHYRDGLLSWRQHKGRNRNPVVIEIPVLPDLQRVMDVTPLGDLTFLTTEHGRPFSEAGFTNWFRERCNEAGLQNLSAHGLRKASATWFAERGATAHQLMAWFGWLTIKQAEGYTRSAERKRLARSAMDLPGTDRVQIFPTSDLQGGSVGKKKGKS